VTKKLLRSSAAIRSVQSRVGRRRAGPRRVGLKARQMFAAPDDPPGWRRSAGSAAAGTPRAEQGTRHGRCGRSRHFFFLCSQPTGLSKRSGGAHTTFNQALLLECAREALRPGPLSESRLANVIGPPRRRLRLRFVTRDGRGSASGSRERTEGERRYPIRSRDLSTDRSRRSGVCRAEEAPSACRRRSTFTPGRCCGGRCFEFGSRRGPQQLSYHPSSG